MTETKMEVIRLMPKEYTQAEANAFKHGFFLGAKSEKEELIQKAVDATICLPYENDDGGYTHLVDVSRPLPVGDNKIAIIFKEE